MTRLSGQHGLLVRARSDVGALEVLYRELAPEMVAWFGPRVPDVETARDLLAETFSRVVCSVSRYRGDSDAAAVGWVWAIARNLLRRYYRDQQVAARARERIGVVCTDRPETPEEQARTDAKVGQWMHAALDELPPGIRQSVWFRLVDELSYEEIASLQGCSAVAARKRVSRGMRTWAIRLEGVR